MGGLPETIRVRHPSTDRTAVNICHTRTEYDSKKIEKRFHLFGLREDTSIHHRTTDGMFSPEMMKMAQEQMANMTPEQMAAMQRQVSSPPRFVPSQQCSRLVLRERR